MSHYDILSIIPQNPMTFLNNFRYFFVRILIAKNSVQRSLVKNDIKIFVLKFQLLSIHHLPAHLGSQSLVFFDHLLNARNRDVDIANILKSIVVHVFAERRCPTSQIQDLEVWLDQRGKLIFQD